MQSSDLSTRKLFGTTLSYVQAGECAHVASQTLTAGFQPDLMMADHQVKSAVL